MTYIATYQPIEHHLKRGVLCWLLFWSPDGKESRIQEDVPITLVFVDQLWKGILHCLIQPFHKANKLRLWVISRCHPVISACTVMISYITITSVLMNNYPVCMHRGKVISLSVCCHHHKNRQTQHKASLVVVRKRYYGVMYNAMQQIFYFILFSKLLTI